MHYDCYFLEPAACQLWVRLGLRLSGRMSVLLPIVLKKSLFADGRKFSGPLVRLSRCEVRDHINYRKNDRWRSHRFYRALQRLKSSTRYICEIFGAPPFSSFSTQSANSGHSRAGLSPKSWIARASRAHVRVMAVFEPVVGQRRPNGGDLNCFCR